MLGQSECAVQRLPELCLCTLLAIPMLLRCSYPKRFHYPSDQGVWLNSGLMCVLSALDDSLFLAFCEGCMRPRLLGQCHRQWHMEILLRDMEKKRLVFYSQITPYFCFYLFAALKLREEGKSIENSL